LADVVIFGASNQLSDLFDCALALDHRIRAVVRNQAETLRPRTRSVASRLADLAPRPSLLELADFRPESGELYALGTTHPARENLVGELVRRFGLDFTTLIHPTAYVSSLAKLSPGAFVGARAVIGPRVVLEPHVFINRAVAVGHDTTVGAYSRLQAGAMVGGHVRIGRGCTIGLGANLIEELEIGDGAFIGAGSVVIRDVPAGQKVAGVPARIIGPANT